MPVRHRKVSAVADSGETQKVQPSDWNDDHVDDNGTPVSALRLLGPLHVAHDDAGLTTQLKLADLSAGTVVIGIGFLVTEGWSAGGTFTIGVGGSDWALGNWWQIAAPTNISISTDDSNAGSFAPFAVVSTPTLVLFGGGIAHTAGALIANRDAGDTTGEADVYALIMEP
jgi:hypothetical protein